MIERGGVKVYDDGMAQLYHGDARDMHFIPDESVDLVVTSPPYYSARKYGGGADMVWDAAERCEHVWGAFVTDPVRPVARRCEKCGRFGDTKRTTAALVITYCVQCDHSTTSQSDTRGLEGQTEKWLDAHRAGERDFTEEVKQGQFCQLCGAWRGQLGLEPSLELYIAHLMQIFDECWRVLKGGVMVVNLGDSYAGSGGAGGDYNAGGLKEGQPKYPGANATRKGGGVMVVNLGDSYAGSSGTGGPTPKQMSNPGSYHGEKAKVPAGLKPLDMCMVPSRVALALQERGWYLRSAIPWIKRASMPSSERGDRWERCRVKVEKGKLPAWKDRSDGQHEVTGKDGVVGSGKYPELSPKYEDCPGCPKCLPNDGLVLRHGNWRPGKSLEWLFILSKTGDYYSDSEGVRVAHYDKHGADRFKGAHGLSAADYKPPGEFGVKRWKQTHRDYNPAGRNRREMDWFYESLDDLISHHEREVRRLTHLREQGGLMWEGDEPLAMLLNPKGYKEAHFATYPMALVEPFIKAYTSEKGYCPECGKPWVRVVEKEKDYHAIRSDTGKPRNVAIRAVYGKNLADTGGAYYPHERYSAVSNTLGWRPTCTCEAERFLAEHPDLFPRTRNARQAKAQDHSTWLTWLERVYNRIHRVSAHELAAEPAIVLDPFIGSGTTCAAATKLGRKSIGVECVEEYLQLAIKRLGGGFAVEVDGVEVEQTQMFTEADT